ncbi:DUF1294 domain-containing protein [Klebsiella pneumoniae]|nr:DUF1294 domain-containing protein [Klebsiella pneumoniae]
MNLNLVCYSLLLLTAVGSALLPYPLAMWFLLSSLLTWLYLWRRQAGGAQSLAPGAGNHAAGAGLCGEAGRGPSSASSAFAIKRKSSPSGRGFFISA